jgi:DedD protein
MDRALLERMVGAVVLVLLFVVFVPALLDGRQGDQDGDEGQSDGPATRGATRTEVIVLNAAETAAPSVAETVKPQVKAPPKPTPKAAPVVKAPPKVPTPKAAPVVKAPPKAPTPKAAPVVKAPKKQQAAQKQQVAQKKQAPREGFAVQLGSFANPDNAERFFAARVREADYPVFVIKAAASSGAVYRVCAGPRPTRDEADKLAARLKADGQNVMVFDLSGLAGG